MKIVNKFDELVGLMEVYGAPQPGKFTAPAAPAAPVAPTTAGSKAGAAITGIAKPVLGGLKTALLDPNAAAQKMAAARAGGISQFLVAGYNKVKAAYAQARDQQLKDFYNKMDFPAGWPKTGSKFIITDQKNVVWSGAVTSASDIGQKTVLNVEAASGNSTANMLKRQYVIELDKNQRAYFSISKCMVSDMATAANAVQLGNVAIGSFVKNEAESNPNYTIVYDTQKQSFMVGKNKTYSAIIVIDGNTVRAGQAAGTQIKGKDLASGQDVEGAIKSQGKVPYQGKQIDVYYVDANFK